MAVDKQALIERFLAEGDVEKAEKADELPERIDPVEHAALLAELGVDPSLLLSPEEG